MKVKQFESFEEMQDYLQTAQDQYQRTYQNQKRTKNLENLSEGDFIAREAEGLMIFGKITSPMDYWVKNPPEDDEAKDEMKWEEHSHKERVESGYLFGWFFSEACPDGEPGYAPVTTLMKIEKELFDQACEKLGFNTDSMES